MPASTLPEIKPTLVGLDPAEIAARIAPLPGGERGFRGRQIHRWLHRRAVDSFSSMSDLPADLRQALDTDFRPTSLHLTQQVEARDDATLKLVLTAADGAQIEAVRLSTPKRVTLCVSSQVGCGFGCTFCRTAMMGHVRNLGVDEIVDQVLHIERIAPLPERYNIVFMGMGEPLANYDAVIGATRILAHPDGLAIGPRRITISTVGLVPEIRRLAVEHPRLRLAVSLTATTDELRSQMMPIGRRYPLRVLLPAIGFHVSTTGQRVTFEYVMLKGVNDGLEDAKRLVAIANEVPSKINLIPYNGGSDAPFAASTSEALQAFIDYLYPRTYAVTVRATQGRDILAACGQLARNPTAGRVRTDDPR